MKNIEIVSKVVSREGEAKHSPSKDISSANLSDYLLKSIWDKVWEIRTDSQGTEYIFGKLPVVTQYGITMYSGDGVDIPSLASGLPFDGRTIWYNPDTQQIEVIGGTGGGSGEGVSNFWDLSGIPSWITNSKPKYKYSEIEGIPDLTKYALVSQIPSLSGYATESWVKNQGYLTEHQDLSGYQPLITTSNKLPYSLISGTPTIPTSLKNPYALTFGTKTYDGSEAKTITASDLGALTSHQNIYNLTMQAGAFTAVTFDPNGAAKTVNIPTTTSHISEGSNLYFTNTRATGAITGGASTIATSNLTASRALISNSSGKVAVSAVTSTELGYLDGVTSSIQTQLNAKVALSGTQTITGEKNFTGGLKVNGSPIYYDSTKKYWKLEGDLLVTGGVTMYGSDSSFTPSTIMDAIVVDGTTISKSGGVLKVIGGVADSVAWGNITGKPTWIGSSKPSYSYSEITGAISTTELQNYLTQNSYLNVTSGDNRYLKLSGGTISGTYGALIIHRTNEKSSLIKYSNSSGDLGHLGFNSSQEPFVYKGTDTTNQYKIWHTGNDGSGSGLDADKLDGVQLNELFSSLSSDSTNKVSITIGGVTKNIKTLYASYTNNFRVVWNNPTSGTYDLNDLVGGFVRHYGSGGSLNNAPSSFGNGAVLALSNGTKGLSGQLAWNIVHNSTTNVTNKLWWRAADSTNGFTYSQWKQIAFTDSNVASATKLETARTIWGKSFDGTADINGKMIFTTNTLSRSAINYSGDTLIFSDDNAETMIRGTAIKFQNATGTNAMILSEGNLGIGITAPAYKLDVNGTIHGDLKMKTPRTIWGQSFDGTGNVSGDVTLDNKNYIKCCDTSGNSYNTFGLNASNLLLIGYGTYGAGYSTSIYGNQLRMYSGTSGAANFIIDSSGNVGIGTTAPDYKFHVVGTSHINGEASFNSSVTLKGTGSTTARFIMSRSSYNYFNYPTDGSLCFGTSNASASTQLFIDGATGNVGVGTVTPSAKLHVVGNSHLKGTIFVTNADATTTVEDSGKIKFNSLNTREDFRSPYIQAIHQGNYSRKRLSIFQSNATNYTDDFVEAFTILPNGNVGIGTASPTSKLHVSGDILSTGAMTFYSMRKLKNVVDERGLSLYELSTIKPTRYTWKDGRDNRLHFGGIADDIQQVLPEVVYSTSDGILTMDYGNAAFAVASSLINPVVDHEKRIAMLEEENKQLRIEVERLKAS